MSKVQVSIDEHQAEPAPPPKGQHVAYEDTAVPSEHERELSFLHYRAEQPRRWIYLRLVRRGHYSSAVRRTEARHYAVGPQGGGQNVDPGHSPRAWRAEPDVRGGVDYYDASTLLVHLVSLALCLSDHLISVAPCYRRRRPRLPGRGSLRPRLPRRRGLG